jgi:hypothetical protein
LKKLADVFGVEWAKQTILPQIVDMGKHPNYLYRMTTVFAITVSINLPRTGLFVALIVYFANRLSLPLSTPLFSVKARSWQLRSV